jgi:CarD family transcriptional regulator
MIKGRVREREFQAKAVAEKTRQRLKKSAKKTSAGARRGASSSRSAARGAAKHKPAAKASRQGAPRGMTAKKTAPRPVAKAAPVVAVVEQRPAVKATQRHGFKINEYIVYPAHGVGQILAIEEQEVAGYKLELFVINFIKDKMTLRVPTAKVTNVGMRKLSDPALVKRALETLKGRARVKRTMWSRRAQEYEAKINSGDIVAIAEVVRDLYRSESQPEQSYSERQLYEAALDRLSREIAVVQHSTETEAVKEIESQLAKSPRRGAKTEGDAVAEGDAEGDEDADAEGDNAAVEDEAA